MNLVHGGVMHTSGVGVLPLLLGKWATPREMTFLSTIIARTPDIAVTTVVIIIIAFFCLARLCRCTVGLERSLEVPLLVPGELISGVPPLGRPEPSTKHWGTIRRSPTHGCPRL